VGMSQMPEEEVKKVRWGVWGTGFDDMTL
jgi:hypothetical protein